MCKMLIVIIIIILAIYLLWCQLASTATSSQVVVHFPCLHCFLCLFNSLSLRMIKKVECDLLELDNAIIVYSAQLIISKSSKGYYNVCHC